MNNSVKIAAVAAAFLVGAGAFWAMTGRAEAGVYGDQVVQYLDTQHADSIAAGYAHDPRRGDVVAPLAQGQNRDFSVRLEGGHSYHIVGACDQDCNDVDLKVFNASGVLIASDVALDDHPVVEVDPVYNETLTVRLEMAACTTEPCYAGARVLRR